MPSFVRARNYYAQLVQEYGLSEFARQTSPVIILRMTREFNCGKTDLHLLITVRL